MSDVRAVRGASQTRMAYEGQQNAGGVERRDDEGNPYYDSAPLSDYPRMLYKRTDVEQVQEWADAMAELKDKPMVINRYDGLLCETCIVHSQTEAEALAELGWDTSARAAYGLTDGLVAATSAKDDEIAALRAEVARMQADSREPEQVKRGPGRPRSNNNE